MSDEPTDTPRKAPVTFKVKAFVDAEQLAKDVAFSFSDLSNGMADQASLLIHYGGLAAKASRQVDDCKMLLEVTESKVDKLLRDRAVAAGEKTTEAGLAKQVAVHERVISLRKALNEAKQIEALAKIAVEGFKHRRDMLVQAGAMSREEMKGELSLASRAASEDALEALKRRALARGEVASA